MQKFEADYLQLVRRILNHGEIVEGRNGVTRSVFGETLDIDMSDTNEFPLLNSRHIYHKGIFGEMAAFLRGPKSIKDFEDQGCNYWKKWSNSDDSINIDYGNSWLEFGGFRQLDELRRLLKCSPNDRRLLISGWNPGNLNELNLPCCHLLYQWYVRDGMYLDLIWYQRSADTMIGIPSDIVLAALFNILLANNVGYKPGRIKMVFGNTHIYEEHFDSARKYTSSSWCGRYPEYSLNMVPGQDMVEFTSDMLTIGEYTPQRKIKFELKA